MRARQWIRHFFVYGLGVVLMNLLPALMVPIYTHRIAPSEFGALELLNRSQEILGMLLSFGLRGALVTFYQMENNDPCRQRAIYSTGLQFLMVAGLGGVLLALPGAGHLSQVLFRSRAYTTGVVLILAVTYFEMLFQMAVLYLQSELRSVLYVSAHTARLVLAIALNLVLVYWLRWGLEGILWATLVHTGIFAICLVAYLFLKTGFAFDRSLLTGMLRFGLPLVPASAFGLFFNNGDRYFLNAYATRADVGIYGLGYKLGMLSMGLVMMPFTKIWSVSMVGISKQPDGRRQLGKIATYIIAACVASTLGLSLFGPYLLRLVAPPAYWEAWRLIPIVGAAYVIYSWTVVMDASFYVTKRTIYKPITLGIGSVVIAALYWYLIPRYGLMGAAWATLGGFAAFAALSLAYAQSVFRIEYQFGRIAWAGFLGCFLYEAGSLLPVSPLGQGMLLRSAILMAFPAILWVSGFLTREERQALGEYWQGLRLRLLNSLGTT
jgi:O-antigen/teichoic acid export membrane protein